MLFGSLGEGEKLQSPDLRAYLQRISYQGSLAPTPATLRDLHIAHMRTVPFENLDIQMGRPITLAEDRFFNKIVTHRRGGWCFELNGFFAALLRELGFRVAFLSARERSDDGEFGPDFDHLTLLVQLDQPWIADVGWGDFCDEPLRLDDTIEQTRDGRTFRFSRESEYWRYWVREKGSKWKLEYIFTLEPRRLQDFADRCDYLQTSPESGFVKRRVCMRSTVAGRITLRDMRLTIAEDGKRAERDLANDAEYAQALREHFGIVL